MSHSQIDMLYYKRIIFFLCLIFLITGCTKKVTTDFPNTNNDQKKVSYTNILKENRTIRIVKTYKDYLIVGYTNNDNKGFISVYTMDTYIEIASIEDDNVLVADDIICYNDVFYLDVIKHKYVDIQEPISIYNYNLQILNHVDYNKEYKYAINSTGSKYIQFKSFPCDKVIEIRDINTNDIIEKIPLNIGRGKELTILSSIYFDESNNYLIFMGNYNNQELKNKDGQVVYGRIDLFSKKIDFNYTKYTDITYNNSQCVLNYNNSSFDDQDQWTPIIFFDIENNEIKETTIQKVNFDLSYIVINENHVLQRITDLNDTNSQMYIYTKEGSKQLSIDDRYKNIVPKQAFMHKDILYIIYTENESTSKDKILEVDLK